MSRRRGGSKASARAPGTAGSAAASGEADGAPRGAKLWPMSQVDARAASHSSSSRAPIARIARIARSAPVLLVALLTACTSQRAPRSSAPADEAPRVQAADCERWTEHTIAVVMSAFDEATQECPHAMRDRMIAAVEEGRPKIRRESLAQCRRHLGEAYDERAASCYESATTLATLHECRFTVAAGDDANSDADPFAKVRGACAKARRGEPRPSTKARALLPLGEAAEGASRW